MKYILRDKSVITGKKDLEHLYTFKNFPVFIGSTDQNQEKDLFADLSLSICKGTGVIQLDKVLPLDVVYSGYHSEAIGGIWEEHRTAFLDFISGYKFDKVLEIGGGNGSTAKQYLKKRKGVRWTIVEPNPVKVKEKNIKVVPKMFGKDFVLEEEIDVLVHSHVFEHLYEPREFLGTISKILQEGQLHLFSVPNLHAYMRNKFTNCLNFEHTVFLTEYFIDYLLSLYGLEIIDKRYFHEHSIFYATKKTSKPTTFKFESKYAAYKKLFMDYLGYNIGVINGFNEKVKTFKGDVFLFGAHIFSQYLLNQGLKSNKIVAILDNSEIKRGRRLYGTKFIIDSPEAIKGIKSVAVILKAGAYQDEVRRQLKSINPSVILFE